MIHQKGYKTELNLNNTQRTLCLKSAGASRFAYNWGLRIKIDEYEKTGKSPNAIELHRRLNAVKKTEFPWMYDVSKCCMQEALRDLETAFKNFFRRVKNGETPGFPKFKSRRKGIGSFRVTGRIRVTSGKVKLPRLGWLTLKEKNYFPMGAKILSATVSERAGRWFVSLQIQEEIENPVPSTTVCGVDVGVKTLATLDDGTAFENPKALRKLAEKLIRTQKRISRRKKGSQNRKKAIRQLRRVHYKIFCVRKDAIHKATTAITKLYGMIGIETLHVNGMLKNHTLAKSIADASFSEFHRQLKYKVKWAGGQVIEVDRFYPSSKTCSRCGEVKEFLKLSERVFHCEQCGFTIDRDHNAAINLRKYTVSSTGSNACEDDKVHAGRQVVIAEAGTKH